jgi:general secretion pathway protein G
MKMRNQSGFMLTEILLYVGLLVMIFAFVGPKILGMMRKKSNTEISFKLIAIKEALNEYRMELGAYPSERDGLRALVENPRPNDDRFKAKASIWPILKEDAIFDDAGNEFVYHCPPQLFKNEYKYFEVLYLGPTQSEDDPQCKHDGI